MFFIKSPALHWDDVTKTYLLRPEIDEFLSDEAIQMYLDGNFDQLFANLKDCLYADDDGTDNEAGGRSPFKLISTKYIRSEKLIPIQRQNDMLGSYHKAKNSKTEYFPEPYDEGLRGSLKPSSFFEDFVGNIQGAKLTATE